MQRRSGFSRGLGFAEGGLCRAGTDALSRHPPRIQYEDVMNMHLHWLTAAALAVGAVAFVGCDNNRTDRGGTGTAPPAPARPPRAPALREPEQAQALAPRAAAGPTLQPLILRIGPTAERSMWHGRPRAASQPRAAMPHLPSARISATCSAAPGNLSAHPPQARRDA